MKKYSKSWIAFLLVFSLMALNACSDDEPTRIEDQEIVDSGSDDKVPEEGNASKDDEDNETGKPSEDGDSEIEKYGLYYVALPDDHPSQIKEYTGFTLSFNKDNHTPNYVSWELLSSETYGSANRNDYDFWRDVELEGCPDKNYEYAKYGFERGHMCPAADQKWSPQAMKDCFSMANMCPQDGDLNDGVWLTLENKGRDWAKRDGSVWIVAGPIYYESDTIKLGAYGVRVPSAFFKAFLKYDGDNSRAIAFVFPNSLVTGNIKDYAMTIDELENELGYDFFPALPDDIENKVEAEFSYSEWFK